MSYPAKRQKMSRPALDFLEHTCSDEEGFSLLGNPDLRRRRFVVRPVARDTRSPDAFGVGA